MELYEKNGNILYILNVLKKYSDEDHMLSVAEIKRKIQEIYNIEIDPRTIRRNINLLKYKLNYDISTRGLKMWAMRNINCVEVIKPNSLRQEMKEIIEKAKSKYDYGSFNNHGE